MRRWFLFALLVLFLATLSCRSQFVVTPIDTMTRSDGFEVDRVYSGNTPHLRFYIFEDGAPFIATNHDWYFKYGTNRASPSMVTIANPTTLSNRVDFVGTTNTFGQPNDDWFCEVVAISKTNAVDVTTWSQGRLLEFASPGAGVTTNLIFGATLNWNTISTFTGKWPIYSADTTVLTVAESGTGVVLNVISGSGTLTGWKGTNGLTGGGSSGVVTGRIDYTWLVTFLTTNGAPSGSVTSAIPSGGLITITTTLGQVVINLTTSTIVAAVSDPFVWKTNTFGGDVSGSMSNIQIAAGAVDSAELATNSVTTGKILDGTVGLADIGTGAVTTAGILDGTVSIADMSPGVQSSLTNADSAFAWGSWSQGIYGATSSDLYLNTNGYPQIRTGVVTAVEILDGSVGTSDVVISQFDARYVNGLGDTVGVFNVVGSLANEFMVTVSNQSTSGKGVRIVSGQASGTHMLDLYQSLNTNAQWSFHDSGLDAGGSAISNVDVMSANSFVGDGSSVTGVNSVLLGGLGSTSFLQRIGGTVTGPTTNSASATFKASGGTTVLSGASMTMNTYTSGAYGIIIQGPGEGGATEAAILQNNGLNFYRGGTNIVQARAAAGGTSLVAVKGSTTNTIWDDGNDGAASGLDADLLDGLSSTSFALQSAFDATSNNAVKLNSTSAQVVATGFTTTSNTTFSAQLVMAGDTNRVNADQLSNGNFTNFSLWACDTCAFSTSSFLVVFPPTLTSDLAYTGTTTIVAGQQVRVGFDFINYTAADEVRTTIGGHTKTNSGYSSGTNRITVTLPTHTTSNLHITVVAGSTNFAYVDNVTCQVVNATGQTLSVAGEIDVGGSIRAAGTVSASAFSGDISACTGLPSAATNATLIILDGTNLVGGTNFYDSTQINVNLSTGLTWTVNAGSLDGGSLADGSIQGIDLTNNVILATRTNTTTPTLLLSTNLASNPQGLGWEAVNTTTGAYGVSVRYLAGAITGELFDGTGSLNYTNASLASTGTFFVSFRGYNSGGQDQNIAIVWGGATQIHSFGSSSTVTGSYSYGFTNASGSLGFTGQGSYDQYYAILADITVSNAIVTTTSDVSLTVGSITLNTGTVTGTQGNFSGLTRGGSNVMTREDFTGSVGVAASFGVTNTAAGVPSGIWPNINIGTNDATGAGGGDIPYAYTATNSIIANTSNGNSIGVSAVGSTISGGATNFIGTTCRDSFIGGGRGNAISNTSGRSVIGGGILNRIGSYGENTIAGGNGNSTLGGSTFIGGGEQNAVAVDAHYTTIGGGQLNTAGDTYDVVGGGDQNAANGNHASIVGGLQNVGSGQYSAIGGGNANTASGTSSTVPGGNGNTAAGNYSLAGGRMANAAHAGAIVFNSDSAGTAFASTGNDQFCVKAPGGVMLNVTGADVIVDSVWHMPVVRIVTNADVALIVSHAKLPSMLWDIGSNVWYVANGLASTNYHRQDGASGL